ncbi:HpcH/HpaI aldolase family protein [Facilibium subflavum]|uniref:HpcH/HpaI aldolase family protein n=1 Tax=Facilibium subflavum TaxID=2219058 RepID=UPI000E64CA87|nr:aldolase/citrate lyase family protein [Facilibium subflavum]
MSLKKKLQQNQLSIGSWLTINHISVVEIMSTAGFEWLAIDLEHAAIDIHSAFELITAIQANGMKALVRVGKNEEVIIKRVLDAGADGVIVPMVNSVECAKKAVSFAKYPPLGTRGVGLSRAQRYGIGFDEYVDWQNNELVIVVQIEHINAVNCIEGIMKVEGVDACIIGPYDLSASMGMPGKYEQLEVREAIDKVLAVAKKMNFPAGFHVIESDPVKLQAKIKDGCTFLAYSLDFMFLGGAARQGMRCIKGVF